MGLIDSETGLSFGVGLQFQEPIGGAGLDISAPSGGDFGQWDFEYPAQSGQILTCGI